jgi:hypothetical protein
MSDYLDRLERELLAAGRRSRARAARSPRARQQPSGPASRRFGIRAVLRSLPVALALLCSLAVVVLAVVLVHPSRRAPDGRSAGSPPPSSSGPVQLLPQHPSPAQRSELGLIFHAQGTVDRRDRSCRELPAEFGDPGRRPSLSQGSPGASTFAALGVLRRPAVASDKLPPRILGAPPHQQVFPNGTIPPVKHVYVRYVRKARHRYGANYYVVPAGDINLMPAIPVGCYRQQQRVLATELAHASARVRAGTLDLERRYLAEAQHNALPYPGVCLLALNGTGNGDGGCGAGGSLAEIENGQAVSGGAPTGSEVYYGLAPDGVHSITFYFSSKYVHHPVTALVINNVFIVRNYRGRLGPIAREIWRAPNGAIIKVIHHR